MYGTASAGFSWLMLELAGRGALRRSCSRRRSSIRSWGGPSCAGPSRRACGSPRSAGTAAVRRHRAGDGSSPTRGLGEEALFARRGERPRATIWTSRWTAPTASGRRPARRRVRARQARSVLRGPRTWCRRRDRGGVSRVDLGVLASGRRPVRGDDARPARGAVLRTGRLGGCRRPGPAVSRWAGGQFASFAAARRCRTRCRRRSTSRARRPATTASTRCPRCGSRRVTARFALSCNGIGAVEVVLGEQLSEPLLSMCERTVARPRPDLSLVSLTQA